MCIKSTLSSSQSKSVGFSTQDEAMDITWSAKTEARCHGDVIYLLPHLEVKLGARGWGYSELGLHQLGSWSVFAVPRLTAHPCIHYQICDDQEAKGVVRLRTGIHYLLGHPVMKSASNDHRIVRAIIDRNVTFRGKASSSLVPPGRFGFMTALLHFLYAEQAILVSTT